MVGHVHDQAVLKELWCNSRAYLHGHSVGGTNPPLLRAMGYGCRVLALDTVFNREVLGDTGRFFSDSASFTALVHEVDASTYETAALGERARARIVERYTWEKIADQYEELFERVTRCRCPRHWGARASRGGEVQTPRWPSVLTTARCKRGTG